VEFTQEDIWDAARHLGGTDAQALEWLRREGRRRQEELAWEEAYYGAC
jgi:hypothetical protein